jgi:hypothetical protein
MLSFLVNWFGRPKSPRIHSSARCVVLGIECLDERVLPSASPLTSLGALPPPSFNVGIYSTACHPANQQIQVMTGSVQGQFNSPALGGKLGLHVNFPTQPVTPTYMTKEIDGGGEDPNESADQQAFDPSAWLYDNNGEPGGGGGGAGGANGGGSNGWGSGLPGGSAGDPNQPGPAGAAGAAAGSAGDVTGPPGQWGLQNDDNPIVNWTPFGNPNFNEPNSAQTSNGPGGQNGGDIEQGQQINGGHTVNSGMGGGSPMDGAVQAAGEAIGGPGGSGQQYNPIMRHGH